MCFIFQSAVVATKREILFDFPAQHHLCDRERHLLPPEEFVEEKQALWQNYTILQIFMYESWFFSSHTFVFIGGSALGVEQSVHKSSKFFILRFTGA